MNIKYFDYTNKEGCEKALEFYKLMVDKYEDVINHFESTMQYFKYPERRFRTQELEDSYKNIGSFKKHIIELNEMIINNEYQYGET